MKIQIMAEKNLIFMRLNVNKLLINFLGIMWAFLLAFIFLFIYINSWTYPYDKGKFISVPIIMNYYKFLIDNNHCSTIEEFVMYKIDISILNNSSENINELQHALSKCNIFSKDEKFLRNFLKQNNDFALYKENELAELIQKYWHFLDKKYLLQNMNSLSTIENIKLIKIKEILQSNYYKVM